MNRDADAHLPPIRGEDQWRGLREGTKKEKKENEKSHRVQFWNLVAIGPFGITNRTKKIATSGHFVSIATAGAGLSILKIIGWIRTATYHLGGVGVILVTGHLESYF
jgi:hypothetical protein